MAASRPMYGTILAWAILADAPPVLAQTKQPAFPAIQVDQVIIDAPGIYVDRVVSSEKSPNTATGEIRYVEDPKLVEETDIICARLGLTFGFFYRITGTPQGAPITIDWITRFPPQGMATPSGRLLKESHLVSPQVVGNRAYRSYAFEYAWEMVPGVWSLEFHFEGRKIGEKQFTVMAQCPIS